MCVGPIVVFLLDALRTKGCPLQRESFKCVPCRDTEGGGVFDPPSTVFIQRELLNFIDKNL
jgi:hypothetical protein